jgi:hypothetical protein
MATLIPMVTSMLRAIGLAVLLVLAFPAATRLALVTAPQASALSTDAWLGVWRDGQNVVWISLNPNELVDEQVTVVGAAYSNDPVGKVAHANMQFETSPMGNRITLVAESDPCAADLLNFGGQLIVRDNGQCGGARFDGVYTHQ